MKKNFCGYLAVFFLILNIFPSIGVYADDDLVIVPSSIPQNIDLSDFTDDDVDDLASLGLIYSILQNGSSVDFSQSRLSTNNPYSDFISYFTSSITGIDANIWDDAIDTALQTYATGSLVAGALGHSYIPSGGLGTPLYYFSNYGLDYLAGLSRYATPTPTPMNPDPVPDLYQSWCSIISGYGVGTDNISIKEPFANPGQFYWNIIFPFSFVSYNLYTNGSSSERNIAYYDVGTLYINSTNDNRFHLTSQGLNPRAVLHHGSFQWSQSNRTFYESNVDLWSAFGYQSNTTSYVEDSYYNDLSSCMIYILNKYRHINLIVDGVAWIDLDYVPPSPNYISIGGNTYINNITSSPIEYNIPDNSYLDLTNLKNAIINAINNKNVLTFEDIENCIVDINGNQVLVTYNIIRNDYDDLYIEQYPKILTPEFVFNPNLLTESANNLDVPKKVVEETVGILPRDIVGVLAIGGILTIFACIIHRLLE